MLDEIVSITGSEAYEELKKSNLQKYKNALRKDMNANPRKTVS